MEISPYMIMLGILFCMVEIAIFSGVFLMLLIAKEIWLDRKRYVEEQMINQNLQNKIITFCMYDEKGKWKGTGKGKVMGVDRGDRLFVSIRKHPFYHEGDLIQVYPWQKEERYQPDVILKVEEN